MAERTGSQTFRIPASLALIVLALIVPAAASCRNAVDRELSGTPKIIEGDIVELQGQRLRLDGIDAPEPGQLCSFRERLYDCGTISRSALMDLTAGVEITCEVLGSGRDGAASLARCTAAGYDLSEGMVYTGWALPDPRTGARYLPQRARAEMAKHGLWRGRFIAPWDWTRGERLPAEAGG